MSHAKRSEYAFGCMAATTLLTLLFSAQRCEAAPQPGLCSGVLTKLHDEVVIAEHPEHICIFSGEDKRKISAICVEGHHCEVEGILDACKDSDGCSEITNVASVRDLTLAKQQEQPPHPESPPLSAPAAIAGLPEEIRGFVEDVARICGSPVNVLENSARFLNDDYRFIALHFEKTRCNDLTAICRAAGCLHQIYVSKDAQQYQLVMSDYVSDIELKHVDGAVALELTTSDGTRLLRWNGAGFH
ncbi:MAG: hypothetical protein WA214_20250 [Pseudolabrys sp.]